MWSCCALRFGIRGPMECLLGVSCRGLKRYKNKGFALFGWEEGWPKGGPGSVQEGLSWGRESDQKKPRRVQVENANILQKGFGRSGWFRKALNYFIKIDLSRVHDLEKCLFSRISAFLDRPCSAERRVLKPQNARNKAFLVIL